MTNKFYAVIPYAFLYTVLTLFFFAVGSLAGKMTYLIEHTAMLAKIEVLEKTCKWMTYEEK